MMMLMMQLSKMLHRDAARSNNVSKEEDNSDHSISLDGNQDIDMDMAIDDEDSDPGMAKHRNASHEKPQDPRLFWRDFDHPSPSMHVQKAPSKDSLQGSDDDDEDDTNHRPTETKPSMTHDEDTSDCPFDEIQKSLNSFETRTTPIRSNISNHPSVSIFLEEGWKGIMITTSHDEHSLWVDSSCATSAACHSNMDVWGFSDDDDDDDTQSNKHHKSKTARVLDSMLGSEDGQNNNNNVEDDSLLWTWIGAETKQQHQDDARVPPTTEISFRVDSLEETATDKEQQGGEEAKASDKQDISGDTLHLEEQKHDKVVDLENNPTNGDLSLPPSLSLFAACTYSRVFGMEYLEDCQDSNSDDNEDDYINWSTSAPIRSTIPYGTTTVITLETTPSDPHSPSNTTEASSAGYYDDRDEFRCFELSICITLAVCLILVFALIVAVIYYGIQISNPLE